MKLANNGDFNFNSTSQSVNCSMKDKSISEWLKNHEKRILNLEQKIQKDKINVQNMPTTTPEKQHKKRKKLDEIRKEENKLEEFKKVNLKKMLEVDKSARDEYNRIINITYYTSSKFISNTGKAALSQGFRMGTREILGFILAESWFELKERIPELLNKNKLQFELNIFFTDLKEIIKNIWQRIKTKFNNLITKFKDSVIGGMLSSISTTIINTFFTTGKNLIRFIREIWGTLVKAIKTLVFNPERLTTGQLLKNVFSLLATGIVTSLGASLTTHLMGVFVFPFGDLVATFLGTLATSITTLGVIYFLQYSKTCQKLWHYLDKFKSNEDRLLEYYVEVNQKLDEYLLEIAQVEFAVDANELTYFTTGLKNATTEMEKSMILSNELTNRNIKLNFEVGNADSVRSWLDSLRKK